MGRSKFPGKPSKHVNRTRVSVLSSANITISSSSSNAGIGHHAPGAAASPASLEAAAFIGDVPSSSSSTSATMTTSDNEEHDDGDVQADNDAAPTLLLPPRETRSQAANRNGKKRTNKTRVSLQRTRTALNCTSSSPLTRSRVKRRAATFNQLQRTSNAKKDANKFILPTRSIHSSRVIKPNKRFLSLDQDTRIVRKRVKLPVNMSDTDGKLLEASKQVQEENTSASNGKIVLRQARLQLSSRTIPHSPSEGPFSASIANSPPRTITCGVCGAVRLYRFVKHARKFNIYSCEACRKFISKQIKRTTITTKSTTLLNCQNGQGLCSLQWKCNANYANRCAACWLKLCLRSFQIPMALKSSLTQLLPKNMQPSETTLFAPLLTWQSPVHHGQNDPIVLQRPQRLRGLEKSPKSEKTQENVIGDDLVTAQTVVKRAKIDLKGPRVKHVCRSASIVLGQSPAVFPSDGSEKSEKNAGDTQKIEHANGRGAEEMAGCGAVKVVENVKPLESNIKDVMKENNAIVATIGDANLSKKDKGKLNQGLSMLPMDIIKPSFSKKSKKISTQMENPNLLNIDFWETYDPDEVVCNGYSIIASGAFPMHAICFLCGSAGKETFLHCCICCEPYHPFCLEQGPLNFKSNSKFTWICPKCTTCSACGASDKQKINCQKCHKAYHPQCFNHKWRTDDRPTVCSNCIRCKSCGTDNITKFVGNLALCLTCFKLRNKGNFCPVCQCCYDDNDFDTKMMECGKCNKWVHAKCEGLSDEHYQILSILPESVEYICCFCSKGKSPIWRQAIQQELHSCMTNILRLICKNRAAREMLKLSPLKTSTPQIHKLHSARRLQFVDSDTPHEENDSSLDNDLEQVSAIFRNKIDFGDSFNSSANWNDSKLPISPCMLEIKNKLNCNEYYTLCEFNEGMEKALQGASDGKLVDIYRNILKTVLPWFDPNVKEEMQETTRLDVDLDATKFEEAAEAEGKVYEYGFVAAEDSRLCNLCKGAGDGAAVEEGRLLYCGQNDWVHANCALWSSEVYEEIDGSLQNVQSAITRGRSIRCLVCKQKGASVGCCLKGCHETYHFPCALKAQCHFIADRTMYCSGHTLESSLNVITNRKEFAIRRSVYIELDTKKKRLCDRGKVNFMVGSLSVGNLGKIVPVVSDTVDVIIPVGFVCSRLFWSTSQPWKLIPYKITTSIHWAQSENYVDRNFTVDHSLPKQMVDRKLREVLLWQKHRDRDDDKSDIYEFEDYEEPQNAGDILSPELTDAILEELPHDLLDGLSMQEMLKEYEELMNLEFKNTEITCNDLQMPSADNDSSSEVKRKLEDKKKSDDKLKPRNQQRSCSIAWLQLDNNLSPAMKKRKMTTPAYMQIVQVDGAGDSSGSECGSPTHEAEMLDPWAQDADVKCEKCHCTYRTKISYERHVENCEAMFTSESETEEIINTAAEETQVIYETFSYQTTQKQIQSTVTNTQTIQVESKTQVQDASGIIYNYQTQAVKAPNCIPPATASSSNVSETSSNATAALLNGSQICLNTPTGQCIIPISTVPVETSQAAPTTQVQVAPTIVDPVTIQPVSYTTSVSDVPFLSLGQQNSAITIDAKVLAPMLNLQQNQWIRPVGIPPKPRQPAQSPRMVVKPRPQRMVQVLPQQQSPQSLIFQHIPQNNMTNVLPFVDAQGGVQLLMTSSAPQVVQLQPDGNFLSLVPNVQQVQPTMIIQQPRVEVPSGQLIVDSNGSMLWAQTLPQVQPVYYGIETVQTTVMQSQQFLPTTMPGMLTTNSSFSATTQVFQTSKLEPVLDGGYVLVNQNHQMVNQGQLALNNAATVQHTTVPQVANNVANLQMKTSATPTTITPSVPLAIQTTPPLPIQTTTSGQTNTIPTSITIQQVPSTPLKQWTSTAAVVAEPQVGTLHKTLGVPRIEIMNNANVPGAKKLAVPSNTTTSSNSSNSITLPMAPFVPEQGIPTNIVTPIPKPQLQPQSRPMSRVLPMQTSTNPKKAHVDPLPIAEKPSEKFTIIGDVIIHADDHSHGREEKKREEKKIRVAVEQMKLAPSKQKPLDMPLISMPPKVSPIGPKLAKITREQTEADKKFDELLKGCADTAMKQKQAILPAPNLKPKKNLSDGSPVKDPFNALKVNKVTVAPLKQSTKLKPIVKDKENVVLEGVQGQDAQKYAKKADATSIYFKIESEDGFDYTATSLPQIWRKVFAEVQNARSQHNLPPLPEVAMNDWDILGLKTKSLRFLLEQLPDAARCKQYKPMHHNVQDPYQFEDDDDEDGCRRCAPYEKKVEKYDMFGWLASKHRALEMYDLDSILKKNTSSSLPMATKFRTLKMVSKYSVGVYRSEIHGRGLFSLRDVDSGEMVIEYAGEVIRSILTDKREKAYNTKGIGCYMFRIDDNLVVDATMKGNAARFINHSCDPNCYSKVVEILGNKHIIIFALRKIICGEELTYDYKFPFEEDKIPCTCGAKRCRKFLN